jgi:hypothetical protein
MTKSYFMQGWEYVERYPRIKDLEDTNILEELELYRVQRNWFIDGFVACRNPPPNTDPSAKKRKR